MRLPVRLKTRLDTRMPVRMGARIETRWFRLNEGTTDYISVPDVGVGVGDYEFKVYIATANTSKDITILSLFTENDTELLNLLVNFTAGSGTLKLVSAGVTPGNGTISIIDNKIHEIKLVKSGNDFSIFVDGTLDYTVTHADPSRLRDTYSAVIGARKMNDNSPIANHINAVMFDAEFSVGGVPSRYYPINDNSSTIIDTVSGQNGTVINGKPDDWGLFEKLPNGNWRGINLSAAWDSPNQILEVA